MTVFATPHDRAVTVTKLRSAGCVFAEDEAALLLDAANTAGELTDMVDQRVAGVPLEYIIGWAEFCGLRIAVDPGVFRPRARTEFLVDQAVALASHAPGGPPTVVVDLCCGSGALGAALVAALETVELYAVDIDPTAVRCAQRNIGTTGSAYVGDLYEPLPVTLHGRVDVLLANAPYVPTEAIGFLPPEARIHEPLVSLDGGVDGLDILRRVSAAAPLWLAPGGSLFVETSEAQAPHLVDSIAQHGLAARVARSEEFNATVVIATASGGRAGSRAQPGR
jgi:release factor glutamine methyltransferase